ncbi:CU044_5270 family protein [Nonomuraea sp. NN258]|uniref:CU044_5270 family protein n=1 Tax=Nonomuraea antri TaxID=2730852 RepID=UPI001567EBD2|nr:CU044_5270 family protein [Nonomuraea antri]NRQ31909.1 CU044_5270 family protein [Nonomuraea antri]
MSDIDHLVKAIDPAPHAPDQGPGARELRAAILATPAPAPRPARRLAWRAGAAVGLAAAVAAAAVLFGQDVLTPTHSPDVTSLPDTSILLAAAARAEAAPQGAYWRLKELDVGTAGPYGRTGDTYHLRTSYLMEQWMAKDGRAWIGRRRLAAHPLDTAAWRRDGSPAEWEIGEDGGVHSTSPEAGTLTRLKGEQKLYWSARPMTMKEIEALPADPEALKQRAAEAIRRDQDFAGSVADGLPSTLASLLYQLPASPRVRAAAYQALATLPGVRVEGPATDPRGRPGVSVTFPLQRGRPGQGRLIIDPGTSKVLTYEVTGTPQKGDRANLVLESGWTDTEPAPPATE